jgi:hypothetical protein
VLRRFAFLPLGGFLALLPAMAFAQAGSFQISENRTQVGTASFDVKAASSGYDSTSLVRISASGLNYELSKTEKLNSANHLIHVILSGIVNGEAVNIVGRPDAGQVLLNISANGRSTTTHLDAHPDAVVLADFDPGALETLLIVAAQQNNRDLWAILPKQSGSIVPVQLATQADQQGTWEGDPITVHHLTATIAGQTIELFSGPENQLLQAEFSDQGFAMVRKGFVLAPPAKAPAAPQEPAPSESAPEGDSTPVIAAP